MIPILALSIPIVAIWTKHQRKIAELQIASTADMTAEKAAQYASHTAQLEDRVRVLATQIEALRDARKIDALLDNRQTEVR
jgi:hypothetical protein